MSRRYSTTHTHLFPGAKLADLDGVLARIEAREDVLLEFSDGVGAGGHMEPDGAGRAALTVAAYRTQRGPEIERKTWIVALGQAPNELRVIARATPPAEG